MCKRIYSNKQFKIYPRRKFCRVTSLPSWSSMQFINSPRPSYTARLWPLILSLLACSTISPSIFKSLSSSRFNLTEGTSTPARSEAKEKAQTFQTLRDGKDTSTTEATAIADTPAYGEAKPFDIRDRDVRAKGGYDPRYDKRE